MSEREGQQFTIHKRFSCSFVSHSKKIYISPLCWCIEMQIYRSWKQFFFLRFIVEFFFVWWERKKLCIQNFHDWENVIAFAKLMKFLIRVKNYYSDHLEYWKEFWRGCSMYCEGSQSYEFIVGEFFDWIFTDFVVFRPYDVYCCLPRNRKEKLKN